MVYLGPFKCDFKILMKHSLETETFLVFKDVKMKRMQQYMIQWKECSTWYNEKNAVVHDTMKRMQYMIQWKECSSTWYNQIHVENGLTAEFNTISKVYIHWDWKIRVSGKNSIFNNNE